VSLQSLSWAKWTIKPELKWTEKLHFKKKHNGVIGRAGGIWLKVRHHYKSNLIQALRTISIKQWDIFLTPLDGILHSPLQHYLPPLSSDIKFVRICGPGSSPGWAKNIVLCSWARHSVSLSTQLFKLVLANLMQKDGVTLQWTSIPSRGEKKYSLLLHALETEDKHQPDGPLGSYPDLICLRMKLSEVSLFK